MYNTPDEVFQELFTDLHKSGIWHDGKIISDAIPKDTPTNILQKYRAEKGKVDFDLKAFFERFFAESKAGSSTFKSDTSRPVDEHIKVLWDELKREADTAVEGSSLIPLPHPYIVPGGRFNEIYYWDSYFTMLGLRAHGRIDMIESMVDNFSWLIDQIGHIPNGNRTYFLGRSQPPYYALMVALLAEEKGEDVWVKYLPYLEKEYAYWMRVGEHGIALSDDLIMNRQYDRYHQERMEMYADDRELADGSNREEAKLFLDLRAACESGWDFSSRWMDDPNDLATTRAADVLPVDLNCLMYSLETHLSKAYGVTNQQEASASFTQKAIIRKEAIQRLFWDEKSGFFYDYDFAKNSQRTQLTLAGLFPLFFNIATPEQAARCREVVEQHFLKDGGLVTTPVKSGQQWDAPNGWAPLQWVGIQAMRNYGFHDLADEISNSWIRLCTDVYTRTGKMLEKYNVEDTSLLSGGGEYPVQDGFGWSNGVLAALIEASSRKP